MFNKRILTFICLTLFIGISYSSYGGFLDFNQNNVNNKYELAKRQIKLGNSYRENQNYDKAFEYLNMAMNTFSKQRNFEEKYWYAVANEYISYLYRDKGDYNKANAHLAIAEEIYSKIITQPDGSQCAIGTHSSSHKFQSGKTKGGKPKSKTCTSIDKYSDCCSPQLPKGTMKTGKHKNRSKSNVTHSSAYSHLSIDDIVDKIRDLKGKTSLTETVISSTTNSSTNEILYLNERKLSVFPADINTTGVKYINLSDNKFKEIPTQVLEIKTLEVLILSNNKITTMIDISRLTNLKELDLSNNKLKTFTYNEIKNVKLEKLDLSNNKSLKTIGDLSSLANSLEILDIRGTKIPAQEIISLVRQLPNTLILYNLEKEKVASSNILFNNAQ